MRTKALAPEIDYLHGEVRPAPGRDCSPELVLDLLRERQLLAAVGLRQRDRLAIAAGLSDGDLPIILCVAADDERALLRTPGGLRPGPALADLAADLAAETGCDVDLHGEFAPGYGADELADDGSGDTGLLWLDPPESDAPLDVVLSRLGTDLLPLLARDTGSPLCAWRVDGWTIVRFTQPGSALHEHGWLAGEGPVLSLSDIDGDRYLSILVGRGVLPGQATLVRLPVLTPTYAADELDPSARRVHAALADQHLQPYSGLSALLAEEPFAQLDPSQVSAALQSPDDDGWFARVLTALGLPAVAAEVFEGTIELPDPIEVAPAGLGAALRDAVRQYLNAGPDETAERGRIWRWHTATVRRPALLLWTVVPELLLGLPILLWALRADERPWWLVLVGLLGAAVVLDAVADLVMMLLRLRRRRG